MTRKHVLCCVPLLMLVCGCTTSGRQLNPYLTLTEFLGVTAVSPTDDQQTQLSTGQGTLTGPTFRRPLDLTLRNFHPTAELNVAFAAWVNINSIRSAEQQDALLADGYVQLRREVRLGSVFTLPVGTFVRNGDGTAGATLVLLPPASAAVPPDTAATPSTQTFSLISPDVILVFLYPPVSCDSIAFYYSRNGEPLTAVPTGDPTSPYAGSNREGAFKTLAQVNVYQCDPLKPGLFIKLGGGQKLRNEYFEGENVTFDFNATPDATGNFATVTIITP
jgi:hypothetical protein